MSLTPPTTGSSQAGGSHLLSSILSVSTPKVLVSQGCCNKVLQTGQLKTTDALLSQETVNVRLKSWQNCVPSEASREEPVPRSALNFCCCHYSRLSLACRYNTPVSLAPLSLVFPCVAVSLLRRTQSCWIKGPPYTGMAPLEPMASAMTLFPNHITFGGSEKDISLGGNSLQPRTPCNCHLL